MASIEEIRQAAEASLPAFIRLVSPTRMLSSCHLEVCDWWEREEAKSHQLLLFPRDHMKSALVAFRAAWYLTKDPTLRILYISSTSNLAQKQLGFIKQILDSKIYRRYWPEHVNAEEGRRARWTSTEIELDHPARQHENIRDPSIFTAGLTTNIVGMHCDIAIYDDVVTGENAYTEDERAKTRRQYSLLASIEGAESKQWVVGTRYHPNDLYSDMKEMMQDVYDEEGKGEIVDEEPIYDIFERVVEIDGEFLWPRQLNPANQKWYGFDQKILSRKRGQYLDRMQFRAQYYNDPSDPDNVPVSVDKFQYFDSRHLTRSDGRWYYKNNRLNLYGAVDFAFSIKERADWSAIVVIGVDAENNVFVLDIDRFKTDRIADYYEHIVHLVQKWDLRKLRMEVSAAQSVIVNELKNNYIKPNGLVLSIDDFRPMAKQGSKEERIAAILEPRYDNLSIWHYRGGNCHLLEEELMSRNPQHDDIKDALASAVETAVKPSFNTHRNTKQESKVVWHPRFGGRSH